MFIYVDTVDNQDFQGILKVYCVGLDAYNKGNNKITELRTILQRESPNS